MGLSSDLHRPLLRRILLVTIPLLTVAMLVTTGIAGFCGMSACRSAAGLDSWRETFSVYRPVFVATILAEGLFLALGVAIVWRLARRVNGLTEGMRDLIRSVVHDLRTPVSQMRHAAERMALSEESEGPGVIAEQCDRLLSLIDMNAEIARLTTVDGVPEEPVDLSATLAMATELFSAAAEESGITLVYEPAGRPLLLSAQPARLQRLVSNLLDNAIKFTPRGGSVRVSACATGANACLTVSDTGIGMSPETQERMYERFFRGDPLRPTEGFGFGLTMVRALVTRYRGTIACTSVEGRGTIFRVTFPLMV